MYREHTTKLQHKKNEGVGHSGDAMAFLLKKIPATPSEKGVKMTKKELEKLSKAEIINMLLKVYKWLDDYTKPIHRYDNCEDLEL